jgi:hypothetical protein
VLGPASLTGAYHLFRREQLIDEVY